MIDAFNSDAIPLHLLFLHLVAIAREAQDLALVEGDPCWKTLPAGASVWTDDYANLFGQLRWKQLLF